MNFFKSVFTEESDPPEHDSPKSEPDPIHQNSSPSATTGGWSFGGLLKTLSTKSESVMETYRRDLKEFGSGLRKEIEVAHGSLGNVSHAIDELGNSVLKSTAQIISHGKDAILTVDQESDSSTSEINIASGQQSLNSKPYCRFDAQVHAIQCDAATYCEEVDDEEEYVKWKLGFSNLGEKREEREGLLEENGAMESIYKRVVPGVVDEETFWCRYYYRVYKLKQAEDLRANIVKRAISAEDEDLSWDVDDDDDEEEEEVKIGRKVGNLNNVKENEDDSGGKEITKNGESTEIKDKIVKSNEIEEVGSEESDQIVKSNVYKEMGSGESEGMNAEKERDFVGNVVGEKVHLQKSKEETVPKADEELCSEGKGGNGEASKDSDFSVVSSQLSTQEEEDLGWDEIEDLSSIDEKRDEKRVSRGGSPNTVDLRKRLSAAEEEEDLSWDIEDDDEPVKA